MVLGTRNRGPPMIIEEVSNMLRQVAHQAILPRFHKLANHEVSAKLPGQRVTVADEEAEQLITDRLRDLLPGSRVIGEEAVSKDQRLLSKMAEEVVWLVDALDGTSNFVAGSPCFSTMVCLLRNSEPVAAWMLSPALDTLHVAEKGGGAWINGRRVRSCSSPPRNELRGAILTRFLPEDVRERLLQRSEGLQAVLPGLGCAGEEYPAIAQGRHHFAVFGRTLPWDHAPGTLFLTEAGGRAARFDGQAYHPAEEIGFGLLAAQSAAVWSEVHQRLFDSQQI